MPVEETMWDVLVRPEVLNRPDDHVRALLTRAVAERLPEGKQLLRVVGWSANGGGLFAPKLGARQLAVAYEVRFAA
jgi:hypothetical protein